MTLFAPMSTDWFSFLFWAVRKSKLGPGRGVDATAIHLVRGQRAPSPDELPTLSAALGPPMEVDLRYDVGEDPLLPLPFGLDTFNRLTGRIPVYDTRDRWASVGDAHRALAAMFGSPAEPSWSDVHDDGILTRLATAGLGAHLLRRREGGYEIDLLRLSRYPVRAPFERYGARLLLSPDLAPEAIQRDGTTARPGDARWERYVMAFQASLNAWVNPIDHLLDVHLVRSGTFVLALRLGLPEGHPLRDALTPFTFGAVAVNSSAVHSLLAGKAYFARILAYTYEGLSALCADAIQEIRWQTFPERLEAQGLLPVADRLPFASDALLWWDALDRFVAVLLDRWADPADPALAHLVETWLGLLPQARFAVERPRDALRRMISTALFWITVMHVQVGHIVGYVQDPTWMPVKIRPGAAADQTLFKEEAVQKMILGVLTAGVEMPHILDDLSHVFSDPGMSRAWASFQGELRAAGAEIEVRNAGRSRPYEALLPERMHVSVSL